MPDDRPAIAGFSPAQRVARAASTVNDAIRVPAALEDGESSARLLRGTGVSAGAFRGPARSRCDRSNEKLEDGPRDLLRWVRLACQSA